MKDPAKEKSKLTLTLVKQIKNATIVKYFGALAEKLGIGLQNLVDGSITRTRLQNYEW